MIESLQIIIAFFCFAILTIVPFNIFNSKKIFNTNYNILDLASFNLITNCTVLLFFSILPITLKDYNLFFYWFLESESIPSPGALQSSLGTNDFLHQYILLCIQLWLQLDSLLALKYCSLTFNSHSKIYFLWRRWIL